MLEITSNINAFSEGMKARLAGIAAGIDKVVMEAADAGVDKLQDITPIDTGDTRQSIHRKRVGRNHYQIKGSKVFTFLDKGTRAHIIRAVNKKALRFTVGGDTVFAKSVSHPGTAPLHLTEQALPVVEKTLKDGIHNLITGLNK